MSCHAHEHEHAHCAFVPPFILEALAQSDAVPAEERNLVQHNLDVSARNINETAHGFYGNEEGTDYSQNEGVIPAYVTRGIAESDAAPDEARENALATLRNEELRASDSSKPAAAGPPQFKSKRRIYDMKHEEDDTYLPGSFVYEGNPSATSTHHEKTIDDVYKHLGIVYDFFAKIFQRDSIDGKGMPLIASVHYGNKIGNAFWNGRQMVFGDGDNVFLYNFVRSIDVIAHELFHGVTQHTANLVYRFQPGALNESVSDVFGSILRQYVHKQTVDEADWLMGDDCILPSVRGVALRSLKAPGSAYNDPKFGGKDPQVAHMRNFLNLPIGMDKGGVHLNSGIPNHAFYLAATAIGGHSWDAPAKIWFDTLVDEEMHSNCEFELFAKITVKVAKKHGEEVVAKVKKAWEDVGVL